MDLKTNLHPTERAGTELGGYLDSIGAWSKRYHLTGRSVMEAMLRPHCLSVTQWHVLYRLILGGATMQADLLPALQIEPATLSVNVGFLLKRGWIEQKRDGVDRRQRWLHITAAGRELWDRLPDLTSINREVLVGMSDADVATAIRVLQAATERLDELSQAGKRAPRF
jgi:MarR family transcriptional regulator, lower aerobic nicotinate degradation pathway regulator